MRTAWELTTIVLRLWLFGLIVVSIVSLSDFIFRRPHGLGLLSDSPWDLYGPWRW